MPHRPLLFFSHANSFPAGTYAPLLAQLETRYRVVAPPVYGHDPRYPVTRGWRALVDEAEAALDAAQPVDAPVVLAGHSFGGFVSLMLAARRPARVQALLMLDSPLVHGWKAWALRLAQFTSLPARLPPASIAARRRHEFSSREMAQQYFESKPVFARWEPGMLQSYLEVGLTPTADASALTLSFTREIEARIYQTLPHDMPRHARRLRRAAPRLPVAALVGDASAEVRAAGLAATRRLVGDNLLVLPGGHLFPMEQPTLTAATMLQWLAAQAPG